MTGKMDSLTDNQRVIYNLFPEYLLDNTDFESFVKIIADEWEYIQPLLEGVPNLAQPDKVPNKFLSYLSYLSDVKVVDSESYFSQREILKRVFDAYSERGTQDDLAKSASRANDRNWLIGDLTYYRGPLKEEPLSLTLPQYQMFTWSGDSVWSGHDRYPDGSYWEDGVIIFNMTNMTRATRDAIDRTIPAGRKYYFNNTVWITSDDVDGDLNKLKVLVYDKFEIDSYQDITYFLRIHTQGQGLELSVNIPWDTGYWSDCQNLHDFQTTEVELYASYLTDYFEVPNAYDLYYRNPDKYLHNRWEVLDARPTQSNYFYTIRSPSRQSYLKITTYSRSDDRLTITDSSSEVLYTSQVPRGQSSVVILVDLRDEELSEILQFKHNKVSNIVSYTILEMDSSYIIHSDLSTESSEIPGFEDRVSYKGSSRWDEDFIWSGRRSLSGHDTGVTYSGSSLYSIHPQDTLYSVSHVDNISHEDYRDSSYSHEVEVEILRDRRVLIDSNSEGLNRRYDADDIVLDAQGKYRYTTSSRVLDANIIRKLKDTTDPQDLEDQRKEFRLKGFKWSSEGTWSGKVDRDKERIVYGETAWSGSPRK